ncbi:hypothetical protein Vi05172_g3050 [Venturia inaequalis]|nr:hypothetical protein Vi05172_g3050 [Venturia inaequalis]
MQTTGSTIVLASNPVFNDTWTCTNCGAGNLVATAPDACPVCNTCR